MSDLNFKDLAPMDFSEELSCVEDGYIGETEAVVPGDLHAATRILQSVSASLAVLTRLVAPCSPL